MHLVFTVQSSNKCADWLEHRINNFFDERRDWSPTEEDLQKAKDAMINELLQKPTSLGIEAQRLWEDICDEEYEFNTRD